MPETLPLTTKITIESQKSQVNRLLAAQFGDGYSQVANDGLNSSIDVWEIRYAPLSGANLITIDAFLSIVKASQWFTWTPFGEVVEKKWRINKDSIKRNMISTELYMVGFQMTQVFDLG